MEPSIFIMRVGDIKKNYSRSVLDNIQNGTKIPIWGYDSNKCTGFKKMSNRTHRIFLDAIDSIGFAYVLFKPSKNGDIIGMAVVRSVYARMIGPLVDITGSNEENGWFDGTITNSTSWDYQFYIDQYWDLSIIANGAFSHATIHSIAKLGQCSIHAISAGRTENLQNLTKHLGMHISVVAEYIKPTFSV